MKAISVKSTKGIQTGTRLKCIDNTGAMELEVIAVKKFRGIKKRHPQAGVSDVVICSVKKGQQNVMHEIVRAVVVRQTMEYRRPSGMRIKFSDNAAVLIDEKNEPKGKKIKGAIAKEVVERFSRIGKIASIIV